MVRFGRWDDLLQESEPAADQIFQHAKRHFARGYAFSGHARPAEAKQVLDLLKAPASFTNSGIILIYS